MFSIDNLPHWITFFIRINPLTYGVDLLRWNTLGIKALAVYIDFLFLAAFALVTLTIAVIEFSKTN